MDWQTKMYSQWIKGDHYEVHKHWLPFSSERKMKFLRKYFQVMDREPIPHKYRRRKNSVEYADAAIMILARIDQMCDLDIPFVAGSRYLSPVPWAVFGEADQVKSQFAFKAFEDIAGHYHESIIRGGSSIECFHFRLAPYLASKLASKHSHTPHYIMAVAINLLHDILINCGPDCEELYDLFTNDVRVNYELVDMNEWEDLRCKVMGRHGRISNKPHDYYVGQVYNPAVPLVSETKIELVSDNVNLADGEKTVAGKKMLAKLIEDNWPDDGSTPPEMDADYALRVQDRKDKYDYLGIGLCCPD